MILAIIADILILRLGYSEKTLSTPERIITRDKEIIVFQNILTLKISFNLDCGTCCKR